MPEIQDGGELIGAVKKGGRGEEIRVSKHVFKGEDYVDVRTWFPGDGGELRAGKGLRFRRDLLPELLPLLASVAPEGDTP